MSSVILDLLTTYTIEDKREDVIILHLNIHGSWISSCNIDLDPAICSQAIDRDGGKGAAAKRDNDEFVAEAVRDTPSQQQQQAPPQQAPPQQVIEQMSHEHF